MICTGVRSGAECQPDADAGDALPVASTALLGVSAALPDMSGMRSHIAMPLSPCMT